ncbi:MAG: hypothetical protein JW876_09175 [Candidatus Krumholzibacteriota bacterium]|nr:hypothetical protein [Candidatus Krumholzibacteriota bacterium]
MVTLKIRILALAMLLCAVAGAAAAEKPVSPAEHFGFEPGADGMLFDYEELIGYLRGLEAASPRAALVEIGSSPRNRPMYVLLVSAPGNIDRIDRLREINRRLALDTLLAGPERDALIEEGRVFLLSTLSMHSSEVAPSQALPLIGWRLSTTEDPDTLRWLDDVVCMFVPSHNPDGMDMVVEHYRKNRGTRLEGSRMPGVYHEYVGHDNNRDFISLTQSDTRAVARIYNLDWFPQVMVEKHQMGSTGARFFVPPNHDPIAENVDAGIWSWIGVFGSNLMKDMTASGLAGVSQHYLFDNYWPGSTETCIWKNVIGFLTEAASAQYARPVFVEPTELQAWGKGLAEYKKSVNMPKPWPGGWWRLADIVEYEIVSTMSILKTCSAHREEILRFRNDICRAETERGRSRAPYYFIMPRAQRDVGELAGIVRLLGEHGVEVSVLESAVTIDGRRFEAGDVVVSMAQPFRPFAKEVLEAQVYPVRHYTPGGKMIRPYDITSWSLPLHRGVECVRIDERSLELETSIAPVGDSFAEAVFVAAGAAGAILGAESNESYRAAFVAASQGLDVLRLEHEIEAGGRLFPAGSFLLRADRGGTRLREATEGLAKACLPVDDGEYERIAAACRVVEMPRIALIETWFHDMDAGWTRYVFDRYGIDYDVLRPADITETDIGRRYDVVVVPGSPASILLEGKRERAGSYVSSGMPPAYEVGMGKEGHRRLVSFVEEGGIVVSWGASTALFTGDLSLAGNEDAPTFRLPVQDEGDALAKKGLFCPGALLRVRLLENHPLTLGMPTEAGVFYRGKPVFSTSIPSFDMDRRVIASFPETNQLMSGYLEGGEHLGNKAALVWLAKGRGQIVLFAFHPQYRASMQGTYKLLFNAILLPRGR